MLYNEVLMLDHPYTNSAAITIVSWKKNWKLDMVSSLIQDSVIQEGSGETSTQDLSLLHHVARRFNALCLNESWVQKKASSC